MSIVSEIKLTVSKTINLGNYENVKIEATAVVGRDDDNDTPEKLRNQALDEVNQILADAREDHVPAKRNRNRDE